MKIPLSKIDIHEEDRKRVDEVLHSGWVMQGPRVEAFEKAVTNYCSPEPTITDRGYRALHAVATSSGTTALHLALELLGVGVGDEVIVPSFSWIASANSVRYVGATPVFCDVSLDTYNMLPAHVEARISPRTKALMIVHQFGMPCNMDALGALALKYKIPIVEDAACAIGSRYREHCIGSASNVDISCLSFHPRKVVTTGEGGMILTRSGALAEKARILRNHGMTPTAFPVVGYNFRLTDLQAAMGIGQIERLETTISRRRALAERYRQKLSKLPGILTPTEEPHAASNFQSYMVRLVDGLEKKREQIGRNLATAGIASKNSIAPIHLQECYQGQPYTGPLPRTEQLAAEGLILPLFSSMKDEEVDFVCATLSSCH